jgi:hypothetical protein
VFDVMYFIDLKITPVVAGHVLMSRFFLMDSNSDVHTKSCHHVRREVSVFSLYP